jgi:hypothetical protein
VVSFPEARRQLLTFRARTAAGPEALRIADRAAVGRVLPAGARIAAPWRQTPIYMLWAPQGRYLNVLDPIFMAAPYPEQHLAWDRVWNGVEPDVPLALAGVLDSEYLAYSIARRDDPLLDRLVADPRIETLYRRFNAVFRVVPGRNGGFVLDWRLAPPGRDSEGPVPAATDVAAWPKVPRFEDPRAQALEGYVDLTRRMPAAAGGGAEAVGAEAAEAARQATRGCQVLVHDLPSGGTGRRQAFGHRFPSGGEGAPVPAGRFELAPSGPTVLWLDGDLLVAVETDLDAVLGRGLTFELPPRSESGRLTIRTCPSVRGEMGLYLLRRG